MQLSLSLCQQLADTRSCGRVSAFLCTTLLGAEEAVVFRAGFLTFLYFLISKGGKEKRQLPSVALLAVLSL